MVFVPPAAAGLLLFFAFVGLRRAWPDPVGSSWKALVLPIASVGVAGAQIAPSAFSTAAARLASVRADAYLLWDAPGPLLAPSLAWPFAWLMGDQKAIVTVGLLAFGLATLLVHVLSRTCGLSAQPAALAQILFLVVPAPWATLQLGLLPDLIEQTLILLLLIHLARRIPHLDGALDVAAAAAFLLLASAPRPAALVHMSLMVLVFATADAIHGQGRRDLRLLVAWGLAVAVASFVHRGTASMLWRGIQAPAAGMVPALAWLSPLPIVILLPGIRAFHRAPDHVRRLLGSVLSVGALRATWLPDSTSLLAGPLAVVTAIGVVRIWCSEQTAADPG